MKYLLNFWWAKDIDIVLDNLEKLDIDKLLFKYWKYPIPHKFLDIMMKDGILDEYDYIIFSGPDLVIKQENINMLINDIETTGSKVMGGVCNVDIDKNKENLAVVKSKKFRGYQWIKKDSMHGIHEVGFNGLCLLAVHTDLLKEFKFFGEIGESPIDTKLCNWLVGKNIPIMTNFDNFMLHLRYQGRMMVGKKEPSLLFRGKELVTVKEEPYLPTPIKYVS